MDGQTDGQTAEGRVPIYFIIKKTMIDSSMERAMRQEAAHMGLTYSNRTKYQH